MESLDFYAPKCEKRESCTLWHNAKESIKQEKVFISVVNPKLIEEKGGYANCPKYYEWKLRCYARGMQWTYQELTLTQLKKLREVLIQHFGYSKIVRMRCGYEAISPDEQSIIAEIFSKISPICKPKYKTFEEHYVKPPRVEGRLAHKLTK